MGIDSGLTGAVLVIAIWYLFVPSVWEVATSAKEIARSFWLSWYPLPLAAVAAAVSGACGYCLRAGLKGWFSTVGRIVFFAGLAFVGVAIGQRVQTIQRFRENQVAYLNRCVSYMQTAGQRQQELLPSLSADEQTLSAYLQKPGIDPGVQAPIAELQHQVDAELDILNNLRLGGREQAAEMESARAHDLRARGISGDAYIESLAKQKPGPELLGLQNGLDPFVQGEAVVLAVGILEMGIAQNW